MLNQIISSSLHKLEFSTRATMLLLSILTTLAVVAGGHRQPFPFKPAQFAQHQPFYQASPAQKPSHYIPRPVVKFQPVQQTQTVHQRYQPSREPIVKSQPVQQTFNSFGSSSSFFRVSGNIVEQTRFEADTTKALLKSLGNDRKAVKYIDAVLESNKCLNNLDDAIDAVENAAKLVEKNGPQILSLFSVVEKLQDEKELTKVVTTSAELLRQLAVLIPSLATEPSKLCNASPEDTIESFSGLAKIIEDVSNAKDLQISTGIRQELKKSSKVISDVTRFLGKLNKSLSSYSQYCGQGKEYQNEFLVAVVGSLEDLAVLIEGFGDSEKAKGIRKNGAFIKKLVVSFTFLKQNV